MERHNLLKLVVVLMSMLCINSVFANNVYWSGNSPLNQLWTTAQNWNNSTLPNSDGSSSVYNDTSWNGTADGKYIHIDTGITANCYDLQMGYTGSNTRMLMTDGVLNIGNNLIVGRATAGNIFDMEGGVVNITNSLTITTYSPTGEGTLNLRGGSIYAAGGLSIKHPGGANGQIDITGGILYLLGNVKSTIEGYVTVDNLISGNGVYSLSDGSSAGVLVELTTVESTQYTKVSYMVPEPLTVSMLLLGTTLITLKKKKI